MNVAGQVFVYTYTALFVADFAAVSLAGMLFVGTMLAYLF